MTRQVEPPPLPGDDVGPYLLGEMVGVGGMATVYQATSPDRGRVALKILHPGKASTEEARRFKREFLALRRLRHANIVRVIESGQRGEYPWIAMEFVNGTDLGTLVRRWNDNPPPNRFEQVERILGELCEALAYVHDNGFIHRDLKPSNVLVTQDGQAKLTDFGVVKASGGMFTTQLTLAGHLVGTVAFMAPESITGEPIDPRADLYSLGAVLYVMLTGQRPIQADSIAGYLARHLTETPKLPTEVDPGIPRRLERICMRMMKKAPDERFATAREVLKDLEHHEGPTRPPVHGRGQEIGRLVRHLDVLASGAGGVVVVSGPQGSGRSALLEEFVTRARSGGHQVATSSGDLADPLTQLCSQIPEPMVDEGTDIGSLKEFQTPGARIESRISGSPWVLVIDDLHRMQGADLSALEHLVGIQIAGQNSPLLIVAATESQQGAVGAFIRGTTTNVSADLIPLSGLERRAVLALVRDRGVSGTAGAVLGSRLFNDLKGMPGAIVEQLNAMLEAEWLEPTGNGNLKATRAIEDLRGGALPIPTRLRIHEENVHARLPEPARKIMESLAVLNMESTEQLLANMTELEDVKVSEAIQALVREGLVRQWSEGLHPMVTFVAPRKRDMVYALLNPEERTRLHLSAAEVLGRRNRRRSGPVSERVANHLVLGGALAEAYPMLLSAAHRKVRAGYPDEARRLLRQAIDARSAAEAILEPKAVQKFRITLYSLQAELQEQRGDLTGAQSAWMHAMEAAESHGNEHALARARSGLGLVQSARGDADLAANGLEEAIRLLPQGDPLWPRVTQALALTRLTRGDVEGADLLWQQLHEVGRDTGNSSATAEALAGIGSVELVRGELEGGREVLERAVDVLQGLDRPMVLLPALMLLVELALTDGRLDEARERSVRAERTSREMSRLASCVRAMGMLAIANDAAGERDAARGLARDATAMARARGKPQTVHDALACATVARALIDIGELTEAEGLLGAELPVHLVGLEDAGGQLLSLKARVLTKRNPKTARSLSRQALARPPAAFPWCAVRIRLDCALAQEHSDVRATESALRRVLPQLEGPGFRLLQLEAQNLASRIGMGSRHARLSEDLREELAAERQAPDVFRVRWS